MIGSDSAREVVICASCGADEMWDVRSSSASAANDAATSVVTTTYDSTRAIDDYAGTTRGGRGCSHLHRCLRAVTLPCVVHTYIEVYTQEGCYDAP